jgi:predicted NBD/HSP70 family sugar kinase
MSVVLGISIGQHSAWLRLAGTPSGEPIAEWTVGINTSYDRSLQLIIDEVTRLADHVNLAGIGVCVTGELEDGGKILWSRALPTWQGNNLQTDLNDSLQIPVLAVGSGSAAARAEAAHPGRHESFTYVLWGAGFSVTNVTLDKDGRYVIQPTLQAHMDIPTPLKLKCSCGRWGHHAEAQLAGASLSMRYGQPASQLSDERWQLVANDMAETLYKIGCAWPRMPIVIGGPLAQKLRLGPLRDKVASLATRQELATPILPAKQVVDPKLIGAVILAQEAAA